MGLADVLLDLQPDVSARLVYGTVVSTAPLTVTVGASTVAASATKVVSASVSVGSYVAVLVQGADRLVIGVI